MVSEPRTYGFGFFLAAGFLARGREDANSRASRLGEQGPRRRAQERSFGMRVGRRQEDARRLLLEARPGEEIRFHPERSEVPGAVREVRLARGDGTVVIASRSQGLCPMQQRQSIAHSG